MKTYAVCFDAYTYKRDELSKLSDKEKYDLACEDSYDEAQVLELDEFSSLINDDSIDVFNTWVYFVEL